MTFKQAKEKIVPYVDFILYSEDYLDYFYFYGCKDYKILKFKVYKKTGQVFEDETI
jgi:hypothetical protein